MGGNERPGRRMEPPTVRGTKKKVDGWLAARHMKDLFHVEITEQDGLPKLKHRSIEAMLKQMSQIREVAVVYPPKAKGQEPIMEMTFVPNVGESTHPVQRVRLATVPAPAGHTRDGT